MVKINPILIGLSVASLGVIGYYLLYKRKQLKTQNKSSHREIQVPNSCVPYVLGKYGCAVRTIQERCSIRIKFISPGLFANETTCVLKGDPENVKLAETIIKSIIRNYQSEVKTGVDIHKLFNEVKDSNDSESILHREDGAKIFADILNLISTDVQEKEEDEPNTSIPELKYDLVKTISDYKDHTQKLHSVGGDNLIPVYVSAVATPAQFWVQATKTKEHAELDLITQELYDFYDFNPEYNHPPEYETIKVGNLYALFFEEDSRWYRIEVCSIGDKNESNPLHSIIDVYFLDYGESAYNKLKNLRIISPEFLQLNFQAIECSLAYVKPQDDTWPEEAIVKFEDLTHSSHWYTLQARVEYNIEKNQSHIIPCLTLIDANLDDLNINNEMVETKYAKFDS